MKQNLKGCTIKCLNTDQMGIVTHQIKKPNIDGVFWVFKTEDGKQVATNNFKVVKVA